MSRLQFFLDSINPNYVEDGIGDAFQRFSHEVLSASHPGLVLFPSRGKDGCIDMVQDNGTSRLVVQAKYCATDGIDSVRVAWRADSRKLLRNLEAASGPPTGQSQYSPWFRTDKPISRFVFCTSSTLANLSQADKLRDEIEQFFSQVAQRNPSLAHLTKIDGKAIEIVDWGSLIDLLKLQPVTVFRWFPSSRPFGLVPFEHLHKADSLRAYLFSSKLSFYSVQDYLEELGETEPVGLPRVEQIVEELEGSATTGVIISGAGGVGKTRLSLEVGFAAKEQGWIVLQGVSRLTEDTITGLIEWMTQEMRVLILFDYMELQSGAEELIETINRLNDTYGLHIRYLGTCRSSYYRSLRDVSRHMPVFLSASEVAQCEQLERYLTRVVHHVLQQCGLTISEPLLEVCGKTPSLAVFVAWLKDSDRSEDINELLGEKTFAAWVRKRARTSFPRESIDRELSTLMGLLPLRIDDSVRREIAWAEELLNTLTADGWIEKTSAEDLNGEQWVCLHDVFADQLLLNHVENFRWVLEPFLRNLLKTASSCNSTTSVLASLQRIHDQPCLAETNWLSLLGDSIARSEISWQPSALLLLRTSLLSPSERISLLVRHPGLWEGLADNNSFQNTLGWHVRWVVQQGEDPLMEEEKQGLVKWVEMATVYGRHTNCVLSAGLKFCPDVVRERARQWILARPTEYETEFLVTAWLDSRQGNEAVQSAMQLWLGRFGSLPSAAYVLAAWMNAGGSLDVIREATDSFLQGCNTSEAKLVYQAWLETGGERAAVENCMLGWLDKHQEEFGTGFVYEAWLNTDNSFETVEKYVLTWLALHGGTIETNFLYQAWLRADGRTPAVRKYLLSWLDQHQEDIEAGFVYEAWVRAEHQKEPIEKRLVQWLEQHENSIGARFVYIALLETGFESDAVRGQLQRWVDQHLQDAKSGQVYAAWLKAGMEGTAFEEAVLGWLEQHCQDEKAGFVYEAWLNSGRNVELIHASLKRWMEEGGIDRADYILKIWIEKAGVGPLATDLLESIAKQSGIRHDSDYLIRAWLAAGGEFEAVRERAIGWMQEYHSMESAGFLAKELAQQKVLPSETVGHILTWVIRFRDHEDALWRLMQLKHHLERPEIATEACAAAVAVFGVGLESETICHRELGLMRSVLAHLAASEKLRWTSRDKLSDLVLMCLQHSDFFSTPPKTHELAQRAEVIEAVRCAVVEFSGGESGRDAIKRFLQWVDGWSKTNKDKAFRALNDLGQTLSIDIEDYVSLT